MKTKIILLVIISLVLGLLIGFLTSSRLRLRKLEPVRTYFSADHFREGLYRIIEPDDDQKEKIDQILDKHVRAGAELHSRIRKEIDSSFKAMRKELDAVLTREQLDKLKEMDKRRLEMMKQNRKAMMNDTTHFKSGSRHPWKSRETDYNPALPQSSRPLRDKDTIPSGDTEQ